MTTQTNASTPPALTTEDVQKCLDEVDAIAQIIAPYASTLTKAQRRAAPRARRELDRVVPLLARLGRRFGLSSGQLDADEMEKQLAVANLALPLLGRVTTLRDMLADTVLVSHGNAWETAGSLYGILARLGRRNPSIIGELAAVKSAFTNKKRVAADSSPEAPPAVSAAPVTPAPVKTA